MSTAFDTKESFESVVTPVEFKSTDDDANRIVALASTFDIDRSNDRIAKGAFKKTVKEKVPEGRIKLLNNHGGAGLEISHVIGTVIKAEETDEGLVIEAELTNAKDVEPILTRMKEGHVDRMSIGFHIKDKELEQKDGQTVRVIKQVELMEVSVVPFPDNPNTEIVDIKGRDLEFAKMTPRQRGQIVKTLKQMGIRERKERQEARTPDYQVSTKESWKKPTLKDDLEGYFANSKADVDDFDEISLDSNWDQLTDKMREWIANKKLLGSPSADTYSEANSFPVVEPKDNALNLEALRSAYNLRGQGTNETQKESIANVVERLVVKHFPDSDFAEQFKDEEESSADEPDETRSDEDEQEEKGEDSSEDSDQDESGVDEIDIEKRKRRAERLKNELDL